jgi:hypothetical protein
MVAAEIIGVALFVAAFVLVWAIVLGAVNKCRLCNGPRTRLHSTDLQRDSIKFYKSIPVPNSRLHRGSFKYALFKDPEGRFYLGEK